MQRIKEGLVSYNLASHTHMHTKRAEKMFSFFILSTIVVGFVIALYILYNRHHVSPPEGGTGICPNPGCMRCRAGSHGNSGTILDKNELLNRLHDHLQTLTQADKAITDHLGSLMTNVIIDSIDNQQQIQYNTRILSGFHDNDTSIDSVMIWIVPGITRQPFWTSNDHPLLKEVTTILTSKEIVESLRNEYLRIDSLKEVWSHNRTPKGHWKVVTLVNQGVFNDTTCQQCPVALDLITNDLAQFMGGNCFCYAMYSCLTRGSVIEPHTGPCNYRIRCHIPLATPTGFHLHVGQESIEWKQGELVMFDDSLVHSVTSTSTDTTGTQAGTSTGTLDGISTDDCRVVFIVDIWHPEVNKDMKKALNSVFRPSK